MRSSRALAGVVLAAATVTAVAACSSGNITNTSTNSSTGSASRYANVTLTWWNNATQGSLLTVWQNVITKFESSHPGITIVNVPIQNEQFTNQTKVPPALAGNSPPDIFQQWGGGQEATQLESGKLEDLTSLAPGTISMLGNAASGWQVDGQQYGIPYDLHVVGVWYRKDLFARAGITSTPKTIQQLETDDNALKAHGITPIAVGSADRWPDAFWWEYFALRECSTATVKQAMTSLNLSAPCFAQASTELTSFMNTHPFQNDFLGTASQVGAGSSAGMVANGRAAMELQGDWDPGVMASLIPPSQSKSLYSELGWFPFPSVSGGAGNPATVLGGGDGFSCTKPAPEPACSEFLQYLDTPAIQKEIMSTGSGLPANSAAISAIAVQAEHTAESAYKSADYVSIYFDTALPTQPGQNLDNAVANFFGGTGTGAQIISSVTGPP